MKKSLPALVIDDDSQVRSFVAAVLESDGWNVSQSENAEQAFNKLSERQWTLVFCDVFLDGTNGYSILRHFTEEQSKARFILMTGHGSAAGAYDYLVKPFSVDNVLKIAESVSKQLKVRKNQELFSPQSEALSYESDIPLIGSSPKFVECLKMVGQHSRIGKRGSSRPFTGK